jgi:flagellar basal-body rod protein FlgB
MFLSKMIKGDPMPEKLSFGRTFKSLTEAINIAQKRHTLIAGNISNLDTPGYKPKEIPFETALAEAIESNKGFALVKTDPSHMDLYEGQGASLPILEEKEEWNGMNWVSIDREMVRLTENNFLYRTSIEALMRKIRLLKEVIREGGR